MRWTRGRRVRRWCSRCGRCSLESWRSSPQGSAYAFNLRHELGRQFLIVFIIRMLHRKDYLCEFYSMLQYNPQKECYLVKITSDSHPLRSGATSFLTVSGSCATSRRATRSSACATSAPFSSSSSSSYSEFRWEPTRKARSTRNRRNSRSLLCSGERGRCT
jgi:hypothetical protein